MRCLRTVTELRDWRRRQAGCSVGLVPTMGALHEGHLSLARRSLAENDRTIATIFVNPAQFDRASDLARYPRDPERDGALLKAVDCDAWFLPAAEAIYADGFQTWVEPGEIAHRLEGASRPGHFRGVATVVLKLLNLTRPDRAYFGRKDAQQLAVIRRIVRDLDVQVEIVPCETVREPDGLAISSRNRHLGKRERRAARALHRALRTARDAWLAGEREGEGLRTAMREVVDAEPLAKIDYVSVADARTFRELDRLDHGRDTLLSLAVHLGGIRLIDNQRLSTEAAEPSGECETDAPTVVG